MAPPQTIFDLACPCGHREAVPASAAGVTIECPRCGRNLLVPLSARSSESPEDIAIVERITGRKFTPVCQGAQLLATLTWLAPMCVVPLAALGAMLHWGNWWPAGAVYPLVGVFWLVGIVIARAGVRRSR